MKKLILLLSVSIAFAACSSHKKLVNNVNNTTTITSSDQDGLSYEKAIVIKETSERSGVDAVYAWVKAHYPGASTESQALTFKDKKPYDILHIVTADGKRMPVYFDITNFYGKF